jgi:hypothetical protein
MLHQKATHNFYRNAESDSQYFSKTESHDISDYELYQILTEYDEMQRKSDSESEKNIR